MKKLLLIVFSFVAIATFSQNLEQQWNFSSIEKTDGTSLFEIGNQDTFDLKNGKFKYSIASKELYASGSYIHQNNLLIFNYTEPKDTVRYYNISNLSANNLVLSENNTV